MKGKLKPRSLSREQRKLQPDYNTKLTFREERLVSGQLSSFERKRAKWRHEDSIALAYKKGDKA